VYDEPHVLRKFNAYKTSGKSCLSNVYNVMLSTRRRFVNHICHFRDDIGPRIVVGFFLLNPTDLDNAPKPTFFAHSLVNETQ